jgi:hypothetical protein
LLKLRLRSGASGWIAAILLVSVFAVALLIAVVPVAYPQSLSGGTISVSPSTVYEGVSATLSITTPPSGGTPPYTCEWLAAPPSGSYSDLATSDCSSSVSTGALSTPGTWSFELQVTTSYAIVTSNAVTVTVLGPDQSFTLNKPLTETLLGTLETVNATWTNNVPSSLYLQITGIVWFEVMNTASQTVMITATSLTLQSGASGSAYLGLSTLAPAQYTVEVFVTTTLDAAISLPESLTITITT